MPVTDEPEVVVMEETADMRARVIASTRKIFLVILDLLHIMLTLC